MDKAADLKRVLLVEDSENDIEMTLDALSEHHLANQVDVVRDGVELVEVQFRVSEVSGVTRVVYSPRQVVCCGSGTKVRVVAGPKALQSPLDLS